MISKLDWEWLFGYLLENGKAEATEFSRRYNHVGMDLFKATRMFLKLRDQGVLRGWKSRDEQGNERLWCELADGWIEAMAKPPWWKRWFGGEPPRIEVEERREVNGGEAS